LWSALDSLARSGVETVGTAVETVSIAVETESTAVAVDTASPAVETVSTGCCALWPAVVLDQGVIYAYIAPLSTMYKAPQYIYIYIHVLQWCSIKAECRRASEGVA
jgi:hypothetical protein